MHQQADGWLDPESLQQVGQPHDLQRIDLQRKDVHLDEQAEARVETGNWTGIDTGFGTGIQAGNWTGIRALPPVGMPPSVPGDMPLRGAAGQDGLPQSSQLVFDANVGVEGFVERRSLAVRPDPSARPARPVHPSRNLGWDLGWEGLNVPGRVRWLEAVVDRGADGVLKAGPGLGSGTNSTDFAGLDFAGRGLESFASLLHDTRNMVTALDLYCGLLEEPGVLMEGHQHFANDLRIVASGSRRLLDKMGSLDQAGLNRQNETSQLFDLKSTAIDRNDAALVSRRREDRIPRPYSFSAAQAQADRFASGPTASSGFPNSGLISEGIASPGPAAPSLARTGSRFGIESGAAVESLAAELYANQNLLAALVGPGITLGLNVDQSRRPIAMATDDLTRVLVNLARNAADAMPTGGHIQISLEEADGQMTISFADTGTGIPEAALESIFSPGVSTRIAVAPLRASSSNLNEPIAWPSQHRGLGLAIVRSIVSAAGGTVWAANRRTELPSMSPSVLPSILPSASSSQTRLGSGPNLNLSSSRDSALNASPEKTESVIPINGSFEPNQGALIVIEFPLPK